ncbi:MAG: hypothetical protein JWN48_1449 [Myxococcaceae bacterium]|nr:hypothetical protein [Myxococcaceae bacterium]
MSASSRPLAVVVQLSAREPSDAVLVGRVTRVRSGVRSAEEALYSRHVGPMLALCLRLLGDRDEAEDVLQESFLDAFEQLSELRDPSRFVRFLTGIVVHKADALFRRRRARRLVAGRSLRPPRSRAESGAELVFFSPRPDLAPELREQLAQLDSVLGKQRDRDRACWLLHALEGYPLEEVAGMLHRPLPLVRRRFARAERALRPLLPSTELVRRLDERRPDNARQLLQAFRARRELRGQPSTALPRALRVAAVVGLVLALVLFGAGRRERHEALPLTLRDQRNLPSAMLTESRHHAFDLSDGSRLTLAAGARVDVLESSPRQLVLALREGRVRFDVQREALRAWRIESAGLTVEVMGTKFVMERRGDTVRVSVEQGAVLLRGEQVPDRVQRLGRGQSFVATVAQRP